jgi:hypothetical protein
LNDYNLPIEASEYKEHFNFSKRLFVIKYETTTLKYNIKDLLSGISTFYKVQNETVLLDNSLIHIGETFIFISFGGHIEIDRNDNDEDEGNKNQFFNQKSTEENGMPQNNLINLKIFNKFGVLIQDPM